MRDHDQTLHERDVLDRLSEKLLLSDLLTELGRFGPFTVSAHWQQGEFHHDYVFTLAAPPAALAGPVIVVSTNCNAGVKEVASYAVVPARWALWRSRCPDNDEFEGDAPACLGSRRTSHWFDPCALLAPDARSEIRPEARVRQRGGGWVLAGASDEELGR